MAGEGEGSGESKETKTVEELQEEYNALQSSYDKEVSARKALETKVNDLTKTTTSLQKTIEANKQKQAENSPEELEKWKKEKESEIRSSVQEQLDSTLKENSTLKSQVNELTVVNSAFTKIAGKFNEDCLDNVRDLVRKHGCLDEDGKTVVYKNANGEILYSPTNRTKKMNDEEFGDWIGSQKPSWLQAQTKAGGRRSDGTQETSQKGGGGSAKLPPPDFQRWSQRDQQEWMTKNPEGARAYMKSLGMA